MSQQQKVWVDLSEEDLNILWSLQQEMGLASVEEVMHALIRQAYTRAVIVCPNCGHAAQATAEDEARCTSCMSLLHLSDEIWQVAVTRPA
jgi:DNA-directed RNA polymerase subunit RPC12/RpoP